MRDPLFTGVDHSESLAAPPEFELVEYEEAEYKAVEYEEVNYEEVPKFQTVDYEEFSGQTEFNV